jgi:hypothetical protein
LSPRPWPPLDLLPAPSSMRLDLLESPLQRHSQAQPGWQMPPDSPRL